MNNTFNMEMFLSELPLAGGLALAFLVLFLLIAGIPAIRDGSHRFIVAAFAIAAIVGGLGVGCLAAECWAPTHAFAEAFEDLFPQTTTGRWELLGASIAVASPLAVALCWLEARIFNWASK